MLTIDGEVFAIDSRFADRAQRTVADLLTEQREFRGGNAAARRTSLISRVTDGVAVIGVNDVLVRQESDFLTSYPVLVRDLQAMDADPEIHAVVLAIDSPGGHATGIASVTNQLDSMSKPVVAHISGLCCSAALRIACHASGITATSDSTVGSIGTIMSMIDASKAFEMAGLERVAITTGPHKAVGMPGLAITDEQRGMLQEYVDSIHQDFRVSLSRRGLNPGQVKAVDTGAVWVASRALQLGLIDHIGPLESVLASIVEAKPVKPRAAVMHAKTEKDPTMADAAQAPATLIELKAACPGASSDFLLAQLEAGVTASAAQTAFIVTLQQERDKAAASAAELAARTSATNETASRLSALTGGSVGNNSLAADAAAGNSTSDPISEFEELVAKARVEFGGNNAMATRSVIRTNPELYATYRAAIARLTPTQADRLRRQRLGTKLASVIS